jgi:4-hydroxy-tetrahydrodipicolinate synthase
MSKLQKDFKIKLRGAILGITTPFLKNGEIDESGFRRNIDFYIEKGIKSLVVGGTYGEVTALTQQERRNVIKIAVEQASKRANIIVDTHHVGSLEETIALTKYAEAIGADLAYILTPYYWRVSDKALYQFYKKISQTVTIAIMLYSNPMRTHVSLPADVVKKLINYENVVAIKAADMELIELSDLIKRVGKNIAISCGWELHAIHGFLLGVESYFGIVGNFNPKLELHYEKALAKNDRQKIKEIFFALSDLRKFFSEVDAPAVFKSAQEMVGLVGGPVRLPLMPLSSSKKKKLEKIVKKICSL